MSMPPLYVVTPITNPVRFRTRWKLYKDFEKHCQDGGAILYTVEAAFGERPFEVTQPDNPRHIQLRYWDEMWQKEAMLNAAIARLPISAEYVAWVDADIHFVRPDWAEETVHQLQHYFIVQMFSRAVDLLPDYDPMPSFYGPETAALSWGYCHVHNLLGQFKTIKEGANGYYGASKKGLYAHCGFAWAARREALDIVGGLMDHAICGSADHHMASALSDTLQVIPNLSPAYQRLCCEWRDRARQQIRGDFGYVPGTIMHSWHGSKKFRKYKERWKILLDHKFCPDKHLKRDCHGLWQFTAKAPTGLRDDLRLYLRQRNEDGLDM